MAIDIKHISSSSNRATQSKGNQKVSSESGSPSSQASAKADDAVNLTGQAQQIDKIVNRLKDLPVSNESRVAELKEKIANGEYQVDADRVASKLFEFESGLR